VAELERPRTGAGIVRNLERVGLPQVELGDVEGLHRRIVRQVYLEAAGSLLFLVSYHLRGDTRVYWVFRYEETGDSVEPIRITSPTCEWLDRKQALRFARLVTTGLNERVAEWLVLTGAPNTEANQVYGALMTSGGWNHRL
jgi:hypothetical protein